MKRNNVLLCILIWVACLNVFAHPKELRIVSLAPSNTTIVHDLGLSHHLLGITKFCTRPKNAKHAIIIGTITNPNLELIAALKPTLILGNVESNRLETLDKIESINLPLLRLGPSQSLQEIIRDVNKVAAITNQKNAANSLIQRVTAYLNIIQKQWQKLERKKVFIEIWPAPLTTVSKHGFIHHVVQLAGGTNIFAKAPVAYPQISMESVIAKKPEAILIVTHSLVNDERIEQYRRFPQLQNTILHQTDASELSQPSLSAFVKAVEHFASVLHPSINIPTGSWRQDELK